MGETDYLIAEIEELKKELAECQRQRYHEYERAQTLNSLYGAKGADLVKCQQERDGLVEVEKAARIIFDIVFNDEICPHFIRPTYPANPWWCDECWGRLETALAALDDGFSE